MTAAARAQARIRNTPFWLTPDRGEVLYVDGATLVRFDVATGKPGPPKLLEEEADWAALEGQLAMSLAIESYSTEEDPGHPGRKSEPLTMPQQASGEGLIIRFRAPALSVLESGGKVLVSRSFPGWLKLDPSPDADCAVRGNGESRILSVYGLRQKGIFAINLRGAGDCGEKTVVVRLPQTISP